MVGTGLAAITVTSARAIRRERQLLLSRERAGSVLFVVQATPPTAVRARLTHKYQETL